MGLKYLGDSFDLHSGGVDLCFPHHENEIAQSGAATGEEFAHHWFHIEHLMVDGAKMSKSLGNLYTLDDLAGKGYSPGELRYALLAGHYRTKLNFSLDRLREARGNLKRIASVVAGLETAAGDGESGAFDYQKLVEQARVGSIETGEFGPAWWALLDDLNTPAAMGQMFTAIKPIERRLAEGGMGKDKAASALRGLSLLVVAFGWILPAPEQAGGGEEEDGVPDDARTLAERRWRAREGKDWAAADTLRDELAAIGWRVKDGPEGYQLMKFES